jgi:hypothetical protein
MLIEIALADGETLPELGKSVFLNGENFVTLTERLMKKLLKMLRKF